MVFLDSTECENRSWVVGGGDRGWSRIQKKNLVRNRAGPEGLTLFHPTLRDPSLEIESSPLGISCIENVWWLFVPRVWEVLLLKYVLSPFLLVFSLSCPSPAVTSSEVTRCSIMSHLVIGICDEVCRSQHRPLPPKI